MKHQSAVHVRFAVGPEQIRRFFPLLRQGVRLEASAPSSVEEFLTAQLGLPRKYVDERIQTVFLDGKPVDDLAGAGLQDGSVLAISAAMPGLAGATLRRGGYFASLRQTISHAGGEPERRGKRLQVMLKVFNVLTEEVGPPLLDRGVRVEGKSLRNFLERQTGEFWQGCRVWFRESRQVEPVRLIQEVGQFRWVRLRVEVEQ